MNLSEIKNRIEGAIKALPPQKLKIALDFLKDLRRSDEEETLILLNDPGIMEDYREAKEDIRMGRLKNGKTSGGMYKIELSRKAAKFYQKADTITVKRLNVSFAKLSENPFQQYSIKKLSGELKGSYRL